MSSHTENSIGKQLAQIMSNTQPVASLSSEQTNNQKCDQSMQQRVKKEVDYNKQHGSYGGIWPVFILIVGILVFIIVLVLITSHSRQSKQIQTRVTIQKQVSTTPMQSPQHNKSIRTDDKANHLSCTAKHQDSILQPLSVDKQQLHMYPSTTDFAKTPVVHAKYTSHSFKNDDDARYTNYSFTSLSNDSMLHPSPIVIKNPAYTTESAPTSHRMDMHSMFGDKSVFVDNGYVAPLIIEPNQKMMLSRSDSAEIASKNFYHPITYNQSAQKNIIPFSHAMNSSAYY